MMSVSAATSAKMSASAKAHWKRPGVRERQIAAYKASWQCPDKKAMRRAAIKSALADPELRAQMAATKVGVPVALLGLYREARKVRCTPAEARAYAEREGRRQGLLKTEGA